MNSAIATSEALSIEYVQLINSIFVISLNSDYMMRRFLEAPDLGWLPETDGLTCVHMGEHEVINYAFFNEMTIKESQKKIDNRLNVLRRIIQGSKRPDLRIQHYREADSFDSSIADFFQNAYRENGRFRRAVKHQLYRNLHPKLKRMGIKNERDARLEEIIDFLKEEIAIIYSYAKNHGTVFHYISSAKEMDVLSRILRGHYSVIPPVATEMPNYQFTRI